MLKTISLDKIKRALSINKKTAFDWRHKVLSSLEEVKKGGFNGIVEGGETFFLLSGKGKEQPAGQGRRRVGSSTARGASKDRMAVIVTSDRKVAMDMKVAALGRIGKVDIP